MSKKIGIGFPFSVKEGGNYFHLTEVPSNEIKSNLIHLLTTKKGSRFKLPNFGTNLHLYLFEPLDGETMGQIEDEVKTAAATFLPNIQINSVNIEDVSDTSYYETNKHGVKINVDYQIINKEFNALDSVSILF